MVIPNLIGLELAAFITLSRVSLSSPGRGAASLAAAIDAVTVIGDGAAAPSRPYTAGPRNCACYPDGKRCEKVDRSL
jgi:hypothetical protein